MMYELRSLNSKDIFPMLKIINKIGINDFKECFNAPEVKAAIGKMTSGKKDSKKADEELNAVGLSVILEVASLLVSKIPECEDELYKFLSSLSGMKEKELYEMPMAEFCEMIIDVIKKPEFKDFTGLVSKFVK